MSEENKVSCLKSSATSMCCDLLAVYCLYNSRAWTNIFQMVLVNNRFSIFSKCVKLYCPLKKQSRDKNPTTFKQSFFYSSSLYN